MRRFIQLLFIVLTFYITTSSCTNEELTPAPDPEWAPVAEAYWTDINKSFFNYEDIDNAVFEYMLEGEDFGYSEAEVESIDVYLSMNGSGNKLFNNYSNLPEPVTLTSTEAASQFGLTTDDLKVGDVFTFSFVVKAKDGRVFDLYNNNICNLIRVKGICSLDAYVLTPVIPQASADAENNEFSLESIASGGDDEYMFSFDKKEFIPTDFSSMDVEIAYISGETSTNFETFNSYEGTSLPSEITISASEAAALFGLNVTALESGDSFSIRFVFTSGAKKFTTYSSGLCGVDFPSNIIYPMHDGTTGTIPDLGFENPTGVATAPPATTTSGTCSLTIPVIP